MRLTHSSPLALLVSVFLLGNATAEDTARESLLAGKKALAKGTQEGSLTELQRARTLFEKATSDEKLAALAHYHAAYAISSAVEVGRSDPKAPKADVLLDACMTHLDKATEIDPGFAEAYALLSSCCGRMIGLAPQRTMELGPRSTALMQKAMKLGPDNPRVVMMDAVNKYYTPPQWGGSKEKARDGLRRSTELFAAQKNDDPIQPDWGHDEAWGFLAMVTFELGDADEAKTAVAKALEINPESGFILHYVKPMIEGSGKATSPPR